MDTANFASLFDAFNKRLSEVDGNIAGIRLSQDKWSLKEIVGHLIDSASNNHQRFVRLQLGDLLDFPVYGTEQWITVQRYIQMDWKDIIALWSSYNRIILKVIEYMDANSLSNVWIVNEDALSLEYLVDDYYKHMEWHIGHFEERLKELIETQGS